MVTISPTLIDALSQANAPAVSVIVTVASVTSEVLANADLAVTFNNLLSISIKSPRFRESSALLTTFATATLVLPGTAVKVAPRLAKLVPENNTEEYAAAESQTETFKLFPSTPAYLAQYKASASREL